VRALDGLGHQGGVTDHALHATQHGSTLLAPDVDRPPLLLEGCQSLNFSTQDTVEALAAFKEKRGPVYVGR